MSRDDHRRYDELLQKTRSQQRQKETVTKGDIALWCLAGVLAVGLYLAPEKTPAWAFAALLLMAALATHPALNIPWVVERQRVQRSVFAMLAMIAIIALYGWLVWPVRPYYWVGEREAHIFMDIARSQSEPKEMLIVRCPSNDESLCTVATKFLVMLQKSGWKTPTGGIERVLYGQSTTGVTLSKRPQPGPVDRNDPDKGLWVLESPSRRTLRRAFKELHINVIERFDQDLAEDTISLYFGPPPTERN